MMQGSTVEAKISLIDLEDHAEILGDCEVLEKVSVGSTLIHKVLHPVMGALILIAPTSGSAATIAF
jgi:hypothetical protein